MSCTNFPLLFRIGGYIRVHGPHSPQHQPKTCNLSPSRPPRNKSAKDTFFLNPFVPFLHSTQKRGRLKDNVRHQNKVVFSRWKSDARVPHTMGFSTKNCVYRPGNNDCRSFSSCHWSGRGVNTTKTKCTVHPADSARLTG